MRKMKDSGIDWIGAIPEDWIVSKIKYKAISNTEVLSENTDVDEKIEYIDIGSVSYTEGICETQQFTFGNAPSRARRVVHRDDVILSTVRTYLKAIAHIDEKYDSHIASTGFSVLSPRNNINGKFLYYALSSHNFISEVESNSVGISYPAITNSALINLKTTFPCYDEQNQIVYFLDDKCTRLDDIIAKQHEVIEKLNAYKQSIISEIVLKGLNLNVETRNSGYDFIGNIPAHWKVCRLRNIGTAQNGISKGGEFFGKGFPFVSYGDVYKNYTLPKSVSGLIESTDEEREKYSVEKGDIFFTRTSETLEEVGIASVCEETIHDATFAGFLIRVRPFTDELYVGYSKYFFRSNHQRYYLVKEMNLVTRASLGQDLLKSMPVLLPPYEEQKKIADYLDKKCAAVDESIAKRQQLIEKLTEYKKSLIFEVVTGKKEI